VLGRRRAKLWSDSNVVLVYRFELELESIVIIAFRTVVTDAEDEGEKPPFGILGTVFKGNLGIGRASCAGPAIVIESSTFPLGTDLGIPLSTLQPAASDISSGRR
jgi:hypothetical protein